MGPPPFRESRTALGDTARIAQVDPGPNRWKLPEDGPVDDSGIVVIGADLEPATLLNAYRSGLFPMPHHRREIAWFSPDPRGIIPIGGLQVSRSLRRSVGRYSVRIDTDFRTIMQACGSQQRSGSWINRRFVEAYARLHNLGWAHSIEIYEGADLVGGLYGVRINGFFAGESMFHLQPDASKVALVHLVDWLRDTDASLLDIQWTTPHLESLGAIAVPRNEYLVMLAEATQ